MASEVKHQKNQNNWKQTKKPQPNKTKKGLIIADIFSVKCYVIVEDNACFRIARHLTSSLPSYTHAEH